MTKTRKIILVLSVAFFILAACLIGGCYYFAFHILMNEYNNIDKPGRSEEFTREFGIQPDIELGAIHVKRVRLHDTSSRWMMFSYAKEPDFVEKLLQLAEWLKIDEHLISEESPTVNEQDENIRDGYESIRGAILENANSDKPDWWLKDIPKQGVEFYYRSNPVDFTDFKYYKILIVDRKDQIIYTYTCWWQ